MNRQGRTQLALGVILILLGAWFLLDKSVPAFHTLFNKYTEFPFNMFLIGIRPSALRQRRGAPSRRRPLPRPTRRRRGPDENLRQRRVHVSGRSVDKTPLGPAALTGVVAATNRGEPAEDGPRLGRHRSLGHATALAQYAARPSQGPRPAPPRRP